MSRFFVEFFCLAVPKNIAGEPFCRKTNKFVDSAGGGSIKISAENILSHSAEKIRRGNPLGCHWFRESKSIEKCYA